MTTPPAYPRIPHLVPGRGTSDDRALADVESELLLSKPVMVEEKLDGANVAVWLEDGRVECALRSGPGGQDRAGQLGPLRAWLGQRTDEFRDLLAGRALYAEWLYLAHAIRYDRLPAYLVGFDLWSPDTGFVTPEERDERAAAAGLAVPPELYRGVLDGLDAAESLLGDSRVGAELMEGIVIRTLDGSAPRVAKLLRAGFAPASDTTWEKGRPRNLLSDQELSWH
jgi:RNA ligase